MDGQFSIWVFKNKVKPKKCPLIRFEGKPVLSNDKY